jgi:ribosomal protein L22
MADEKDKQAKAAEPEAEKPKAAKAKAKADDKPKAAAKAKAKADDKPKAAAKAKADDKPKATKAQADDKPKAAKADKDSDAKADDKPKAAKADKDSDAKADDKPKAEDKPKRRGSAETAAAKAQSAPTAPTNAAGDVEVRAVARFVRIAPRKARLVMDHIRGRSIEDARALLTHTPRAAAVDIKKLLESAVANAENNFELDPDDLRISRATADEGPTIKRFRPRAMGRATPIHKRTSHMTITLTAAGDGAGRADKRKARK